LTLRDRTTQEANTRLIVGLRKFGGSSPKIPSTQRPSFMLRECRSSFDWHAKKPDIPSSYGSARGSRDLFPTKTKPQSPPVVTSDD